MKKEAVSKTQKIRLVDVFLLGPFMIWFGTVAGAMPTWARVVMVLFGIATIYYNGKNYLINAGAIK